MGFANEFEFDLPPDPPPAAAHPATAAASGAGGVGGGRMRFVDPASRAGRAFILT